MERRRAAGLGVAPRKPLLRTAVLAAVAVLSATGLTTATAQQAVADTGVPNGDVIANLWSWNWASVASECTGNLDPAGYGAVWVAPPAESLKHPSGVWWDVYQPYSYKLNSRFGTQAEFAAMISTCHAAGIKVYTDAVVNHTAAQTGTGYDGTVIGDKYDPPMYDRGEYNVDVCDRDIANWSDLWEVQHCELLDLPDLDTSDAGVRGKLAGYLNSQLALGVDGFRVDAAKHIPAGELADVVARLNNTTSGARPYVFHEVFPGEPPSPGDYFGSGDVLDFTFGDKLKSAFQGDIASLSSFGNGLLPAANSVSFVTNHDTERNGRHLTYKDGATAVLANVFQLAYKHTTPTVYAGFQFSNSEAAPPNSGGFVTDTDCGNGWYCLNRDQAVTGMVAFHNAVGAAAVANWQSPTSNVIGFGRGSAGFVAINNSGGAYTGTFTTGMANGSYCNVITACANQVTVSGGQATVTVPAKSAVAFHTGGGTQNPDQVSASYTVQAETSWGQNVFVVGNVPQLGSWNPANAVPLTTNSSTYPRWHGSGTLPANTNIEYKFVIKQDGQPVIWETGANRTYRTGGTGAVTIDGGTFRR
ncbi:carbohydrate-binding module family 20 domain-containing protein [Actinophytocola algeriensis]|uniref:Alpha-amylase n=1 Tax=Actinophytocola algeriensis TaxID=1768010 RepID=A0A7W7VH52_9PSEU|nr:carbohydrate-binding module family 20 domain-containing protein [Actinophytocola algeriensis]MBB4910051.1 alpha-amylase [Actinophytocola algeriensis]MBE1476041.1 alpha-amylase [Actinophytocola algeriensis]